MGKNMWRIGWKIIETFLSEKLQKLVFDFGLKNI
jgi:hypothetical protein